MKFLVGLLLGLFLILGLTAFTTTEITKPTAFSTQTSTSVNVSGGINASAYDDLTINTYVEVMIMNRSCSTCDYSNHSNYIIQPSNSTSDNAWNRTISLGSGYNWIYLNFTNVTNVRGEKYAGSVSTSAKIVNIDFDVYLLNVGGLNTLNFTLDSGNITTAGNVLAYGCLKYNCSQAAGCVTLGVCA